MPSAVSTRSPLTSIPRRASLHSEGAMKLISRSIGVLTVGVLVATGRAPLAQSGIRFHHVHLNSVNPDAAADYYTKVFTTSVKTTFNGEVAVKTVNGPYLLFTKVATPPPTQPQSAIWHFGWNTPDSRAYLERFHAMKLEVVPMFADPENSIIEISSDALPNFPTTAKVRELRTQGVQPARVTGFQYLHGPEA